MSDERPRDGASEGEGEHIPIEPTKREPKAKISRQSLIDLGKDEPDRCPSCGAELPDRDATLCLQCGFDLKENRRLRTKVGVEEVEEAPGDFSQPGVIPWQATLGAGLLAIVVAAVIAYTENDSESVRAAMLASVRVLVHGLVHVGLGVVAAIVTALFLQQKFGKVEFAVGRMALAVGLFFLSIGVGTLLGGGPTAQWIIGVMLGVASYYLVIWRMFSTTHQVAGIVAGMQALFWFVLKVYAYLDAAGVSASASSGPGG
jgi:hypothetical protein